MSKIEQFEFCDKLIKEIVPFILTIEQRSFVFADHKVCDEEFVITVNYFKSQFEHKTNEFVRNIIKEAQNTDLYRHNWKFHWPCLIADKIVHSE